jgi:hypothetical protein
MPSYKKLAVFALAASTVYPALAAPIRYEKPHTGSSGRGFSLFEWGKTPPPENLHAPPVHEAPTHPEAPADPQKSSLLKKVGLSAATAALVTWLLSSGSAVPPYSGPTSAVPAGVPAPAMKRTTETSESQPITEMEGRAVGAYKLDKWVKSLKDVCLRSLKMRS